MSSLPEAGAGAGAVRLAVPAGKRAEARLSAAGTPERSEQCPERKAPETSALAALSNVHCGNRHSRENHLLRQERVLETQPISTELRHAPDQTGSVNPWNHSSWDPIPASTQHGFVTLN